MDDEQKTNVVDFTGTHKNIDIKVEKVLEGALKQSLKHIIIIGRKEDGQWYNASSSDHIPSILWMIECAKSDLLRM